MDLESKGEGGAKEMSPSGFWLGWSGKIVVSYPQKKPHFWTTYKVGDRGGYPQGEDTWEYGMWSKPSRYLGEENSKQRKWLIQRP